MIDLNELNRFRYLNEMAEKGGIVFVGSDFFASMPMCELAQSFRIDENIYDRSVKGCTIADVSGALDDFVLELDPRKVFLNLGSTEAASGVPVKDFIADLEWLMYSIHNRCDAEIYVVSLPSDAAEYNLAIRKLCDDISAKFIDVSSIQASDNRQVKVFNALKLYIRKNLDFTEIMTML